MEKEIIYIVGLFVPLLLFITLYIRERRNHEELKAKYQELLNTTKK